MDALVADLLASTGALGVWLLGPPIVVDNQRRHRVLAFAVKDASVKAPVLASVEGETHFDFVDWQLFAEPVGRATIVFVFDDRSSLGLIRLRMRNARASLEAIIS